MLRVRELAPSQSQEEAVGALFSVVVCVDGFVDGTGCDVAESGVVHPLGHVCGVEAVVVNVGAAARVGEAVAFDEVYDCEAAAGQQVGGQFANLGGGVFHMVQH